MKYFKYIRSFLVVVLSAVVLTTSNVCTDRATAEPVNVPAKVETLAIETLPLAIVNNPKQYLDKTLTFKAKFDKFSTLGLDYKPAFKSSEEYISFLIKRDDTTYDIPLSELKLFLQRTEAEKFIELKTNDEIKITGIVFSDALGDAWMEVKSIVIVKKAPDNNGV